MNHLQDASEEITKPETQYWQAKNKNAQARFGTFSGPTHIWKQNSDFHKPPFIPQTWVSNDMTRTKTF